MKIAVGNMQTFILDHILFLRLCCILFCVDRVLSSTCPEPHLINAEVDLTKFPSDQVATRYKASTVFYYKCKDGYHFKRNAARHKIRCNDQGEWEPKPIMLCYDSCNNQCASHAFCVGGKCHCDSNHTGQFCKTRLCRLPKHFLHGRIEFIDSDHKNGDKSVREGTQLIFICDSGYSITKGSHVHTCTHEGWDWQTQPVCERNICSRKPLLHGAPIPDQSHYLAESRIQFRCSPGYKLIGQNNIYCTADGVWSDSWPICIELTCPIVLLPNGIIDLPNTGKFGRYKVGAALQLNCLNGYTFIGESQNIRCQGPPLVKWSSEPGKCIPDSQFNLQCVQEGKIMKIENGKKKCVFVKEGNAGGFITPTTSVIKKTEKPLTIVICTAGGLLLLLLIVITLVAFQRRRLARNQRGRSGGHRLSGDDDRMSFVYYSNDVHVMLPSYDEAMQNRRINHPPPYLPSEDGNRESSSSLPVLPTSNTNETSSGSNLYETIDEIRSTVNAVRDSLSSSSRSLPSRTDLDESNNAVSSQETQDVQATHEPTTVAQNTENDRDNEISRPSGFNLYDGHADEPIYASVQRILSHSLVLANQEPTSNENNTTSAPAAATGEDDVNVDTISLGSDDGDCVNPDTEPLL